MKKILCLGLSIVLATSLFCGCSPQNGTKDKNKSQSKSSNSLPEELENVVDEMDTYLQNSKTWGSVLVSVNGGTIFDKAYGNADSDANIANETNTIYQIGSITKQFTGMAILQLEQQDKMSADDTLDKYFDADAYEYLNNIKVSELCNMTAGFGDYVAETKDDIQVEEYASINEDDIIKKILDNGPTMTQGEFYYSNSSYYLLGNIIEQVSGMSLEDYYKNNFFKTLEMDNSGIIGEGFDKAQGYTREKKTLQKDFLTFPVTFSAGGIVSSTGDLDKWTDACFATNELISGDITQILKDGAADTGSNGRVYNYGWNIASNNVYTQGGTTDCYGSFVLYDKKNNIQVYVLSNIVPGTQNEVETVAYKMWNYAKEYVGK